MTTGSERRTSAHSDSASRTVILGTTFEDAATDRKLRAQLQRRLMSLPGVGHMSVDGNAALRPTLGDSLVLVAPRAWWELNAVALKLTPRVVEAGPMLTVWRTDATRALPFFAPFVRVFRFFWRTFWALWLAVVAYGAITDGHSTGLWAGLAACAFGAPMLLLGEVVFGRVLGVSSGDYDHLEDLLASALEGLQPDVVQAIHDAQPE